MWARGNPVPLIPSLPHLLVYLLVSFTLPFSDVLRLFSCFSIPFHSTRIVPLRFQVECFCSLWPWDFDVSMKVRKVSYSESDLQGHSRSLVIVPLDRPHDFLIVLHCYCVSVLQHFWDIISYFLKLLEFTWPWTHPFSG